MLSLDFLTLEQLLRIALDLIAEIQFRLDSFGSDSEWNCSTDSELTFSSKTIGPTGVIGVFGSIEDDLGVH